MNITTTYKTNANGTGQILAKGFGKQRTVTYDHSKSPDWNHGNAAGTLLLAAPANPFSTALLVSGLNGLRHEIVEVGPGRALSTHRFSVSA